MTQHGCDVCYIYPICERYAMESGSEAGHTGMTRTIFLSMLLLCVNAQAMTPFAVQDSSGARVTPKIIVRKRTAKIFGEIGNWLKKSKGSANPGRAEIAKCWSKLGGLLNNYPTKITGSPTAAEIRRSVLRCARNVTGITSSFRGNSQLHSEHS